MENITYDSIAKLSAEELAEFGKTLEEEFADNIREIKDVLCNYCENPQKVFPSEIITSNEREKNEELLKLYKDVSIIQGDYDRIYRKYEIFIKILKQSACSHEGYLHQEIESLKSLLDLKQQINYDLKKNIYKESQLQNEINEKESLLKKIQNKSIEYPHHYSKEYLQKGSEVLQQIKTSIEKYDNLKQKLQDSIHDDEIKSIMNATRRYSILLQNNHLLSWGKCIEKITKVIVNSKKLSFIDRPKELAVSYLISRVLTGEISFHLFDRLTSNYATEISSKYNFRECYEKFTKSVSEGIQFDCISPQYLPHSEISYPVVTSEIREISYRPNTNSDISPDLINGNYYAKPEGNLNAIENWIVKLSRENTFFLMDLDRLATLRSDFYENINCSSEKSKGFFNFIEGIKSMYPQFESVIDTLNALHGTEINTQKFFEGLKELMEECISPIDKKKLIQKQIISEFSCFPQMDFFQYIFTFAHDKDLANYVTRVGGFTEHRTPGAEKDILNQNDLMNRSLEAYHNPLPQEHYVILAKKMLSLHSTKKPKEALFFPMSDEGKAYDSHFNVYFQYINSILIENNFNDSQAWNSLFYLFLEVNGISFSYGSNKKDLYIPVYNKFLLNVTNQTARMIREMANVTTSYQTINENVLFFPFLSFSPDEISQICTEEKILNYFEKPYQKLVDDTKGKKTKNARAKDLKALVKKNKVMVDKTLPQQVCNIVDHLTNNPNPVSMRMCTALLYKLLGGQDSKYESYENIFIDPMIKCLIGENENNDITKQEIMDFLHTNKYSRELMNYYDELKKCENKTQAGQDLVASDNRWTNTIMERMIQKYRKKHNL